MGRKKKQDKTVDKRKDNLNRVMGEINKNFKKNVVKLASDQQQKEKVSTGIKEIDEFIGGGFQRGNFSLIIGQESSSKTSLIYHTIANSQKMGLIAGLIDMERSFSPERAEAFGVDLNSLVLISDAEDCEQAMDILKKLCQEKVVDFLAIDSIQGLSPRGNLFTKKGVEKSLEDETIALLARRMSEFFARTSGAVHEGKVAVVLVGQLRTGGIGSFITTEVCSGGRAKDYWNVLSIKVRRGKRANAPINKIKQYYTDESGKQKYKTVEEPIGFSVVFKLEKTKITESAKEGTEILLPFYYESGFNEIEKDEAPLDMPENSDTIDVESEE